MLKIGFVLCNLGLIYLFFIADESKSENKGFGETLTLALACTLISNIFIATLLTIFFVYSFAHLVIGLAVVNIIFFSLLKLKKVNILPHYFNDFSSHPWEGKIVIVFLIVMGILYLGFPTKYMFGGIDPGLYLINGVHIAETGSMQYKSDEFVNQNYEELEGFLQPGYPALFSPITINGMNGEPGEISPQFMPMFPAALAVGYDLAGIDGLVRVNGIIAIISILFLYYLVKKMFSYKTAVISTLLIILNPAQIWTARITESEILSQLLFLIFVYMLWNQWDKRGNRWFGFSGMLLGIGVLNRIDTYIYGFGLFAATAMCICWKKERQRGMLMCSAGYGITGAAAFLYGWWYHKAYFISHFENRSLVIALSVNAMGIILILSAVLLRRKISKYNLIKKIAQNKNIGIMISIFLVVMFLYAYFIRPLLAVETDFKLRAMREFCWYTTFLMIPASIYGLFKLMRKPEGEFWKYVVFLAIGLSSTFAYIINPSISPFQIWASRRWITVNIPLIIILGCYGISELRLKLLPKFFYLYCTLFMLFQSRLFLIHPMYQGVDKQFKDWEMQQDTEKMYFTENVQIASVLRYVYGLQVYLMDSSQINGMDKYIEEFGELYYIGNLQIPGSVRMNYSREMLNCETISGDFISQTIGSYPKARYREEICMDVGKITKSSENTARFTKGDWGLQNAYFDNKGDIVLTAEAGLALYGPGISLDSGKYIFSLNIDSEKKEKINLEIRIVCNGGKQILENFQIQELGEQQIEFVLDKKENEVEFQLFADGNTELICSEFSLKKGE